ncbi:hypothetical protein PsorP6_010736 [Peronosclerospora sorghi]|uniref:Uncharacterized protein n=1 Tax=Peronosclerospora sorghi TaxID=230839 RepID=A0ACC0VWG7_9STRA|nr:hypothetical protein PsorP6_010736 [Peronosclerospora sorghi]
MARRAVLSLTSRFCLPEQGMTTLDYLSSGSAVVVRDTLNGLQGSSLSIVTCQHVACPWLFPHYFTATWDWLQFVNENHVRYSLQLLALNSESATPAILLDLPLASQLHTHESKDLALLTLADPSGLERWQWAEKAFGVRALGLETAPCAQGDKVVFTGHTRKDDEGYQLPKTVGGHFVGRSNGGQAFASSDEVLEEGMCGGAVIRASTDECVGIVEGIVPVSVGNEEAPPRQDREAHATWQMRQALAGYVAFIPSSNVKELIDRPSNLLVTGMDVPSHLC